MWGYTDKVQDHFINPRNNGEIADADGIGEVGNIVCGDAMKLYVKLDGEHKTLVDVKFQTFGCASAIASASALTELLIGKTVEEAAKVTNQDIADYLGSLPEAKMHCSVMGMEAFQAALADMRKKHPDWNLPGAVEAEGEDRVICRCFNVTERKIREVVKENNLKTLEQVTYYTKAGGGCGECKEKIQQVLDEILKGKCACGREQGESEACASCHAAPMNNLQKMMKIQSTFDTVIRPGLQADGGDAELVDINDNEVFVRLRGRCAVCPSAIQTLKHWVEAKLREMVSPNLVVVEVK